MGLGCDDGQLASEQCAVSRGLDYAMEAAKVAEISPETFERCIIKKRYDESKAQRQRNMRTNGVH